jgi:hypothetical protein
MGTQNYFRNYSDAFHQGGGFAFSGRVRSDHRGLAMLKMKKTPTFRRQMRRVTLGKSSHTFTPQKCEPSVQIGVVIPART